MARKKISQREAHRDRRELRILKARISDWQRGSIGYSLEIATVPCADYSAGKATVGAKFGALPDSDNLRHETDDLLSQRRRVRRRKRGFVTHITTERLKELIAQIGEIADCSSEPFSFLSDHIDLLRELLQRREADRWIPTSEALPADGESALVFVPQWEDAYLRNRVAWIDLDGPPKWVFDGQELLGVTHWRPLPEFKEEK